MAKPNYNFEKRQRELARKKKQDEKRQRKLEKNAHAPAGTEAPVPEASKETS
jgi:hypothetical protein